MKDRGFVDTNLWIYLYSDADKGKDVRSLVDKHFEDLTISTQVLGEFFHATTRKGIKSKLEARKIILDLTNNFRVVEVLQPAVFKAMTISIKYNYSYWDCLILASAIESNCSVLYTEDMHHGQIVDDCIRIVNPFT